MKIINLHAENIKRVKVVDITPDDNVVVLEGKNKQGKTSTLDSIAYALGGKGLIGQDVIRDGQQDAKITINVGEYIITRHWTGPEKSYLKIESKDGMKPSNPQTFLDNLIGDLAFDPLAFIAMNKDKRINIIKTITGLNFDDIKDEYTKKYEERRLLNRDLDKVAKELENYTDLQEIEPVRDIDEIQQELLCISEHNSTIQKATQEAKEKTAAVKRIETEVNDLLKKKEVLLNQINELEQKAQLKPKTEEYQKIQEELSRAKEYREVEFKQKRKKELENSQTKLGNQINELNQGMQNLETKKQTMIENAKMPIDGLTFAKDDILYNNHLFENLSQAEQIHISMAIAIAENPKLKIVRILNGSLLDNDAMSEITKIAKENDYQVWIERVSNEPSGNAIFIEDGEVKQ